MPAAWWSSRPASRAATRRWARWATWAGWRSARDPGDRAGASTWSRPIEARARERGLRVMVLSAQTHALGFYERLGYTAYGPVFDDAGLPHRWMRRPL